MKRVGIRELKAETSVIIRQVREAGAEYVVTHRGHPVAVILPLQDSQARAARPSQELLAEMAELRQRIAGSWQTEKGGLDLLEDQRR